jgi:septal ring factor EnvC (AmiA/AmiB activator)
MSDEQIVEHVAVRVHELQTHLDAFSERLRNMRRRNRELEAEIASFEDDIARLRDWLRGQQEELQ